MLLLVFVLLMPMLPDALAAAEPPDGRGARIGPPPAPASGDGPRPAHPRPLRGVDRLRVDLRPGGRLEFSGVPPEAVGEIVWENEGLRLDAAEPAAAGVGLGPLRPPDWLRLSGTLEPSGAGVEAGAAGVDLADWHGLGGILRIDLETRLRSTYAFGAPLADALGGDYAVALPATASLGPLSLETRLMEATWRPDTGIEFRWSPDAARLALKLPDPLPYLGFGDAPLALGGEVERVVGAEPGPLTARGWLTWTPPAGDAGEWFRPRLGLGLRGTRDAAGELDLDLRARLGFGGELIPGRHLELAFEYSNEDLLRGLWGDEEPAGRVAGVRLSF